MVHPVSLLHSSRVDPAELDDQPAELLEPALAEFAQAGGQCAVLLPLFFGPSGALHDYLPPRLDALRCRFPHTRIVMAPCLESEHDDSAMILAGALQAEIKRTSLAAEMSCPQVVVTDHGSPLPGVTAVRNRIGQALATLWPDSQHVSVASMERRDGAAYDFNEPLLATALAQAASDGAGQVVVALQFLFAGRHAGPAGDVADICATAIKHYPHLRIAMTAPIGESEAVLELLARRFRAKL